MGRAFCILVFLHSWCIAFRRLARWDVVEFKIFSTFQAQGNMQTLLVPASHYLHSYKFCVFTRSYGNVGSASFENGMGHWSKFVTALFVAVLCASATVIPPFTVSRVSRALVYLLISGKGNMGNGREYGKGMSFVYVSWIAAATSRLLWHLNSQNINFFVGNLNFLYDHAWLIQNMRSKNSLNSARRTCDCVVTTYVPKLMKIMTWQKRQFTIFFL